MKRPYLFLAIASIVFSSFNLAWAGNQHGNPFDQIWEAIAGLNERIDNIQLIPGPPGPEGPQGPQGEKGEPGDPGPQVEKIPEEFRPTKFRALRLCKSDSTYYFRWDGLDNSIGSMGGQILGQVAPWGSMTILRPDGSRERQKILGHEAQILAFGFSSAAGLPFELEGYIYWQGFVVPLPITSGVTPASDGCIFF